MMTFFTVILILIGANAIFMVFSLNGVSSGGKKEEKGSTKPTASKIYPLHSSSSKYKNAI